MLKRNITSYNLNVFDEIGNKWGIVTGGDKTTGFNCLTVSWGGFGVLWGKNVAYLFVRHSWHTFEFLEKSDSVTISFLSDEYKKEKGYIGTVSGRDLDKVKECGLHYTYDPDFNGAYITEADYCFKMKKLYSVDIPYESLPQDILDRYYPKGDMHRMYVCEIKQFLSKEKVGE